MNRNFFTVILEQTTIGTIAIPVVDGNNFFRRSDRSDRSDISDTKPDKKPESKSLPEIPIAAKDLATWILQQLGCGSETDDLPMQWLHGADNFTDIRCRGMSVKPE